MAVTMQQVAELAGVSRGTVDRALHHKEGVREEVAERIRATAREMGYISNRLVMQQTQQWKIGVVLHSGHSSFVQMLCELFESFSERELLPNITVIVRAMQDMDVQHQLTLIDELVTTEHIDGLALMPLANTLVRDRINTLSEQQGIPVVTFNTDITDANRIAYVGADNIASGRAAAALLGMVMQGHGSVLPILGQRSGHYADSQRFTGFSTEMAESFPDIRVLHPECSFLDESLSERIAMRAIQSDSELRGIYLTSAGREGVYRAVHAVRAHNQAYAQVFHQTISTMYFLFSRMEAAFTTVRIAFAMRPCLPMTLPMSSGATVSSMIVAWSPCFSTTFTSSGLSTRLIAMYLTSSPMVCLLAESSSEFVTGSPRTS